MKLLGAGLLLGAALQAGAAPRVDADGALQTDALTVRPSNLLSPQARQALVEHLQRKPPPAAAGSVDIAEIRAYSNAFHQPAVDAWLKRFPTQIEAARLGGVAVEVLTPRAGIAPGNAGRVLINLHGGSFNRGWPNIARAESLPVAGIGRVKVITIDYRMAPEHGHPAALEDVEAVYRELLKAHPPSNIGLFGCSAGGALVGQALVWLQRKELPRPGAAGIFCAGLMPGLVLGGDSNSLAGVVNTDGPAPSGVPRLRGYFDGVDWTDPLLSPALAPQVLAAFPPTLFVTGTRDYAMSNLLVTHQRLLAASVETQLLVQEGLGHSQFVLFTDSPEALLANTTIWRFFDRHLGR